MISGDTSLGVKKHVERSIRFHPYHPYHHRSPGTSRNWVCQTNKVGGEKSDCNKKSSMLKRMPPEINGWFMGISPTLGDLNSRIMGIYFIGVTWIYESFPLFAIFCLEHIDEPMRKSNQKNHPSFLLGNINEVWTNIPPSAPPHGSRLVRMRRDAGPIRAPMSEKPRTGESEIVDSRDGLASPKMLKQKRVT